MRIKELKNKIVLAELDPEANYIMLVNPAFVKKGQLNELQVDSGMKIYFLFVHNIDKAIKFVEIPKKK